MNSALPCTRVAIALTAVAVAACGCAGGNNAASAQGEQPYKTMYGITSEGTTTDLYTEMFGSNKAPAPATNVAAAQPATTQSVTSQPIAPVQPGATATRPGQATATTSPNRLSQTTASNRAPQPAYGQPPAAQPVQVAQQPAPPPEPDVPTAYGITANGPTTDLYTAIFGPRHSDSQ